MKERPILFSAPMVRAILAGTKTQTRRALRVQPPAYTFQVSTWHHPDPRPHFFAWQELPHETAMIADGWCHPCPYGQPGDRLWVRETWAARHQYDGHQPAHIPALTRWHYAATEERGGLRWRPSIHMPRVASRIALEVTCVRVERLQDISEDDARAEGDLSAMYLHAPTNPRGAYAALWESINGPGSWDTNPWVWVPEFKLTQQVSSNVGVHRQDPAPPTDTKR